MKNTVTMIVETPRGSMQKFDRDPATGLFQLTKFMPKGMAFPYDFGYIPSTLGEDGDPLDIICLSDIPTFTGCQINCRILGAMQVLQTETDGGQMRNDRYIGIPEISQDYGHIKTLSELPSKLIRQLESFFINYNTLAGKKLKILRRIQATAALKLIHKSICKENLPAYRVELMLPAEASNGKPFPPAYFSQLKTQLTEKFGGLTCYTRSPLGYWKDKGKIINQALVVYEILTRELDQSYWQKLKEKLEKKFHQQEILIIHSLAAKI
jgi:inorganic pyrophosphatase